MRTAKEVLEEMKALELKALELDLSDPETISAVWRKGQKVPNRNDKTWRRDDAD